MGTWIGIGRLARHALIGCAVLAAVGAMADGPRFREAPPWQKPAGCESPNLAGMEWCRFDPWDQEFDWNTKLLRLAESGKYEELEARLREASESIDLFPNRRYKGVVLEQFIRNVIRVDAQRPAGSGIVELWSKAIPDSGFVLLLQAAKLYNQGWKVRGGGYASSVSAESWQIFQEKLKDAEDALLRAPAELKKTAAWSWLLLPIALERRNAQSRWETIYADAVERWPLYVGFSGIVAEHLLPQWGGSWELIDAFAGQVSQRVAASERSSHYAKLYSELGDRVVHDKVPLNWPKLRAAFQDWLALDPSAAIRFASFACHFKDKEAFRLAMESARKSRLDGRDRDWLRGYSAESCERWASRE